MAKEAEVEKRRIQEAVTEWESEKRRRVQDGETNVDDDEEDMQDVQVQYRIRRVPSLFRSQSLAVVVVKRVRNTLRARRFALLNKRVEDCVSQG